MIEKRIFNFAIWLVAVSVLLAILTSCSPFDPYAGLQATTPAPLTVRSAEAPERDWRWGIHNLGDWTLTLTAHNGKAGH